MGEELRAMGYLCPGCGKTVQGTRDPFVLASSDAAVACSCGRSVLHTQYDGLRVRVTAPCGICGKVHSASCGADRLFHGETAFSCAETGQFCAFLGSPDTVEAHLKELAALSEKQADGGVFLDSVIMYEILSELRDIAQRPGGITCRCGSKEYTMRVRSAAVELICPQCGGRLRIPAATDRDLDDLCCQMKLVIPGRAAESRKGGA